MEEIFAILLENKHFMVSFSQFVLTFRIYAVGNLAYDLTVILLAAVQSASSFVAVFLVLHLPRPHGSFLEIDAPLLGVPHYRPLIP